MSGLAKLNYTLKDRYILTASFRADASSKFRDENKVGYFLRSLLLGMFQTSHL